MYLILAFCLAMGQYWLTNIPGRWAIIPIYIGLIALDVIITKIRMDRYESQN